MVSSNRQAIACILVIFGAVFCAHSQTVPEKTATITGKITFKDKGIAGITVVAAHANNSNKRYKGTSDQSGNYRITNIPPGSYNVNALAQLFVMEDERASRALLLAEGEALEDINFSVVRGGVITGKITDADNQPLIEEQVILLRAEDSQPIMVREEGTLTDDRGVYRIFGLRPGKYKVSVGHGDLSLPDGPRRLYRQTFYPSVTDGAKATVIEVTEGSESSNVDIVVGRAVTTYTVSGRIEDEETGKPLPKVRFGVEQTVGNSTHSSMGGITSNAQGEFKFQGVLPGRYLIFFVSENSDVRPDSISVDVVDRDITGLLIKASKGASLSGVVILEGNEERPVIKGGELYVQAWFPNSRSRSDHRTPTVVKPDGSFKIGGLRSGTARLSIYGYSMTEGRSTRLGIVRIESNGGVLQPTEIELKDGEQVSGLRLVVQYLNGAIRGVVRLPNAELPAASQLSISLKFAEGSAPKFETSVPGAHVDSRGRFSIEGLAPGTYEVHVFGTLSGGEYVTAKQQVTVTNNTTSETVLTLETRKP